MSIIFILSIDHPANGYIKQNGTAWQAVPYNKYNKKEQEQIEMAPFGTFNYIPAEAAGP